ncbi:diguanylate cyclase [Sulfuricella sp. T08]|uniref:GGDEF domain-containing protein n=1 Tax=Sulfuricella sp. T08 TaxID=1632857 RepID=UPI000617A120|nr:GGDEF domain-containing protein [Sulfuricella sp. T08]GAO36296.1 diguanylate cyclase [Sulfuricella sp. T08]
MNLDPRTLLFSLILTYALTVLSLLVAALGGSGGRKRDGMGKWAAAMFLETLTWTLIAARGGIPDVFSIIVANGLKATSHALILAAIYEFQQRRAPHWQYYLAPIALSLVMAAILVDDIGGRFIWGGLIFGFQMVLIGHALLSDQKTRAGRAWRLLFGGVAMIVLVLGLRAAVALSGHSEFAQPQNSSTLHPVQIISFIAIMATALLGSIGFVLMIKERTDREIMHMAMTDSLTQVPNRRALMAYAEHAMARRNGSPLALLMIDVDHFKLINDTHGHLIGDEVLRKVATRLARRLRGHDLLGRYGGEEFCVISPDTDTKGALTLAESLRETIASTPFATENGGLSITISIGISHCPSNVIRELIEVLAESDSALYTAKQTGRNKVVGFGVETA